PQGILRGSERNTQDIKFSRTLVEQHCFDRIACRWIVELGVHDDATRHVNLRIFVHVDVADALGVAQHWDFRRLLNRLHQLGRATRDYKVDFLVQLEEGGHVVSRLDQFENGTWDLYLGLNGKNRIGAIEDDQAAYLSQKPIHNRKAMAS